MAHPIIGSKAREEPGTRSLIIPEERLRRWLGLLRQPDKLATEELIEFLEAHEALPENHSPLAIGQAGTQLILNAMERLRPQEPSSREQNLPYEVLTTCFVDGAKLFQAAGRLGLSERQLSRERSRAIRLLKAELEAVPEEVPTYGALPEPIPAIRGFLPRPAETRKLENALSHPGLVIVHGPPGIGKTSLMAEIISEIAVEQPVFWYRFRPGVNTSLAAILFEVGDHLKKDGSPDLATYLEDALPSFDTSVATRLAIRGLSDRPRLLAFDDYQLVEEDRVIKALLEEFAERLVDLRVILISQHRYLGLDHSAAVEVGPFVESQTTEFLSKLSVSCSPQTVKAIHRWTNGNPHMLKLAASWLKSATPDQVAEGVESLRDHRDIQDFLLGQLTNIIDPDDREILKGASIFRSQFSDDALAFVTGRTRGAVMDSSMRLVRSYIATRNRDGDSAFFHGSVRGYVYDRIPPEQRRALHERASQWYQLEGNSREVKHHSRLAQTE